LLRRASRAGERAGCAGCAARARDYRGRKGRARAPRALRNREPVTANRTVELFDAQFRRQASDREFALNPFESAALPHVRGRVLDLGCGLGNLTLEAARRGCSVRALDASPAAVARIRDAAREENLSVRADVVDLGHYRIEAEFDTIVAIGLLMFFPRARALEMLADIRSHVAEGGCAVLNVLIEGTTYLDLFEPGHCHLFGRDELERDFADWKLLLSRVDTFDVPDGRRKVFSTLIAEKPGA
jgi:tellurite methyltransferase